MADRKKCTGCRRTKALTEFHRNAERPDGHASRCRACVCKRKRTAYRQDATIADHNRAYMAAYRAAIGQLRDNHREEFESLLAAAKAEQDGLVSQETAC